MKPCDFAGKVIIGAGYGLLALTAADHLLGNYINDIHSACDYAHGFGSSVASMVNEGCYFWKPIDTAAYTIAGGHFLGYVAPKVFRTASRAAGAVGNLFFGDGKEKE